jgi:hypothetical protein
MTNSFNRIVLLGLFFFLAATRCGYAQRLDYEDKIFFADSVKNIKVWTYIEGDTSYRRYRDAVVSITEALNRKGYLVDIIEYETGKGISPQEWMHNIISGLKRNEAFLEVSTQVKIISAILRPTPNMKTVTSSDGLGLISLNTTKTQDSVQTNYSCIAFARLYVNWAKPGRIADVPVYSRKQSLESGFISPAVKYTLGGIPASKHPAVSLATSDPVTHENTEIEITLFGGYTLPSKMDITEGTGSNYPGKASFNGNGQYGLEIGFPISKNADIILLYQRLGTVVSLNTPKWEEAGPLTIDQNYILSGINYNFRLKKTLFAYAGMSLGALNIVPREKYLRDYWYFILGAKGGVKFYLSRWIGFRIQAEILYQVHTSLAPFLFSNNPTNIPVDAASNMIQAGVSAGVILRLGNR